MSDTPTVPSPALADWLLAGVASLILIYLGWLLWTYLGVDGYLDHMEANVAIPSWLWMSGRPIYPAADRPIEFLTTFGPLIYLANAAFFATFGGSILTSKLGGVLAAAGTVVFVAVALRRVRPLGAIAVAILALAGILLMNMPPAFWNRPDSFLLLLAGAGLCLLRRVEHRGTSLGAALTLGVIIGLSVNLKVHAFLYFLPMIAWFAAGEKTIRRTILTLSWIGIPSIIVFLLPFALPGVSMIDYVSEMLRLIPAVTHGEEITAKVLRFSILYAIPASTFLLLNPSASVGERRRRRAYGITFIISLSALFYPATTTGAGTHHLMPLAPFAVDFLARLWAAKHDRQAVRRTAVAIFAIVMVAISLPKQKQLLRQMDAVAGRGVGTDLRDIIAANPGRPIEMGYGSSFSGYQDSFLRPLLVFAGNPFSFEAMTFMELRNLKQEFPPSSVRHLESCVTAVWLIPKDEVPFSLQSYYDGKPAFGEAIPRTFLATYEKSSSSRYFDLWTCAIRSEAAGTAAPR